MNEIKRARIARSAKRVTIHDVAARADVSIKTVSRVLNKEPAVREGTRDRVLHAVRALNYEPHPLARGLAGKRTHSMGLIYENPSEFSYVQKALQGVFEACRSRNLSLLLRPCPEQVPVDDVRQFINQTRVDGAVLLAPMGDRPDIIEMLKELETPMAQVSPGVMDSDAISVNPKDMEACALLTEHVLSSGHRRVAFIQGDPRHGSSHERLRGFVDCLSRHGRLPAQRLIIAANDDMAAGAMVAARELGLDVPRDLSVVGFDDSPIASHTWPPLTTMRQPIRDMASAAAIALIDQVAGEAKEPRHRDFDCELIVRASLAAPATPRE